MKLMRETDIPAFVQAIADLGYPICAVGHRAYVLGDADLPRDLREAYLPRLREIEKRLGDRDHLKLEIVAYLRSIGRYVETTEH